LKIEHVMADGTVRDSIEGYIIPFNDDTRGYYHFIAEHLKKLATEKRPHPTPEKQRVAVVGK